MEGLEKALPLFGPKHFIFPFLAHALGTLVGALVTASIAKKNIKAWTIALGLFFLVGGVTNIIMLPSLHFGSPFSTWWQHISPWPC
jgi:hypothetical protein